MVQLGSGKTGMIERTRRLFSITANSKFRPKKWQQKAAKGSARLVMPCGKASAKPNERPCLPQPQRPFLAIVRIVGALRYSSKRRRLSVCESRRGSTAGGDDRRIASLQRSILKLSNLSFPEHSVSSNRRQR